MHFKAVVQDPEAGKMLLPPDSLSIKALAPQGFDLSSKLSLISALSYGVASMAMVFINKAVLLQYPHSMTLLILQQVTTAVLIHVGRALQLITVRSMDWKTSKRLLPLSMFYNANVAFALASLKGVNIPMYIALKRLTPLAVLVTGFFFGKAKPSTQVSRVANYLSALTAHQLNMLYMPESQTNCSHCKRLKHRTSRLWMFDNLI